MPWAPGSWSSWSDEALVACLRAGRGVRVLVWDLFPSFSGREERVEVALSADGDGFVGACEVQQTEHGVVEERFAARWDEGDLLSWLGRARASYEPSLWLERSCP
jgi:hypothetical protein